MIKMEEETFKERLLRRQKELSKLWMREFEKNGRSFTHPLER